MKNITMSAILIASLGTFALADETNIETSNLQKVENSEVIIDDSDVGNNGFYVGLGYGTFLTKEKSATKNNSPQNAHSIMVTVGYQFHDNIALEAKFNENGDFDMNGNGFSTSSQAYGLFIKGIYPMYDNSILPGELYALLGYGIVKEIDDDVDDNGLSLGLGYSYTFNGNWGVAVEYINHVIGADLYEGVDSTLSSINMSATYRF